MPPKTTGNVEHKGGIQVDSLLQKSMSRRLQASNSSSSASSKLASSTLPLPIKLEPVTIGRARDIAEAWLQRYPPRMTPQERKLSRMLHAQSAQPRPNYSSRTVLLPETTAHPPETPTDPVVLAVQQALAEAKPAHKRPSMFSEHRGSMSSQFTRPGRRGTQNSLASLPVTPILTADGDEVDFDAFQKSVRSQIRTEAASFQRKLSTVSRKGSVVSFSPETPPPAEAVTLNLPKRPSRVELVSIETLKSEFAEAAEVEADNSRLHSRMMDLEVEVERWRTLFRVEASRRAELVDARDRIAQLEAELETARSEAVVKESRVFNAIQRQRSLEQRLEVATDTITDCCTERLEDLTDCA